jgi:hypothetical protein
LGRQSGQEMRNSFKKEYFQQLWEKKWLIFETETNMFIIAILMCLTTSLISARNSPQQVIFKPHHKLEQFCCKKQQKKSQNRNRFRKKGTSEGFEFYQIDPK